MVHPTWPSRVLLEGPDYLILAFDRWMRRKLGHGAVCRILIEVDGLIDADRLAHVLENSAMWCWLTRLRLADSWRMAAWEVADDAISHHPRLFGPSLSRSAMLHDAMMNAPVGDPSVQPSVAFDVHHVQGDRSILVFWWHHALLDARGAELLLTALASHELSTLTPVSVMGLPLVRPTAWWRALWIARRGRNAMLRRSFPPPTVLSKKVWSKQHRPVWMVRTLSEEQTVCAAQRATDLGAGPMRSAWHLVATVRAMHAMAPLSRGDYLVPVPQDRRKRGSNGPIMGNKIATIFYRIPTSGLNEPAALVKSLVADLRTWMRGDEATAYLRLLDLCRMLPTTWLRWIMSLPSAGRLATLGLSDVGESLRGVPSMLDHRIVDVTHLPANLTPPGWTVVFTRRDGRLRFTVVGLDEGGSTDEVTQLADAIEEQLVGTAS